MAPPIYPFPPNRSGGEWIFEVADDGIGFEARYAERIFGVFKRLHSRRGATQALGSAWLFVPALWNITEAASGPNPNRSPELNSFSLCRRPSPKQVFMIVLLFKPGDD